MRQNFSALVGIAIVLMLAGGGGVLWGGMQLHERNRIEQLRQKRCAATRKAGKQACCLVCGRYGVNQHLVAMGGKGDHRTQYVHLCQQHNQLGGQQAYDRLKKQRASDPRVTIGIASAGLLAGVLLLLVLLLARRKWVQQPGNERDC